MYVLSLSISFWSLGQRLSSASPSIPISISQTSTSMLLQILGPPTITTPNAPFYPFTTAISRPIAISKDYTRFSSTHLPSLDPAPLSCSNIPCFAYRPLMFFVLRTIALFQHRIIAEAQPKPAPSLSQQAAPIASHINLISPDATRRPPSTFLPKTNVPRDLSI